MNGPKHEIENRQAEAAKRARLAADFIQSKSSAVKAIVAEVEKIADEMYPALSSDALDDPESLIRVSFDVVLNLAPGSRDVTVVARSTPPVRTAQGTRVV